MNRFRAAVLTGVVYFASSAAAASTIEYVLETSTDAAYGSLPSGTAITISFLYDNTQPDLVPGIADTGAYDLLTIIVSAAGETALFKDPIAGSGSLNILNTASSSNNDRLSVVGIVGTTFAMASGSIGGVPVAFLQLDILDATDSVFSSTAIPAPGLVTGDFTSIAGLIADGLAIDQAPFSTFTSLSGQVVPEPSTALLLSVGLAGLAARRRSG